MGLERRGSYCIRLWEFLRLDYHGNHRTAQHSVVHQQRPQICPCLPLELEERHKSENQVGTSLRGCLLRAVVGVYSQVDVPAFFGRAPRSFPKYVLDILWNRAIINHVRKLALCNAPKTLNSVLEIRNARRVARRPD